MTLRTQMLTLSLATLLVPWFGWMLVQELEEFLRENQETALRGIATTLAESVPDSARVRLYGRGGDLPLRDFETRPVIDGFSGDWPEADSTLDFEGSSGTPVLALLGGRFSGQVFLFIDVTDTTTRRAQLPGADTPAGAVDAVVVVLRSGRGLTRFRIQTAAPGPLLVSSQTAGGGQLEGYWRDTENGYRVELALPRVGRTVDLSIGVEDAWVDRNGITRVTEAGTLRAGVPASWLTPAAQDEALSAWLERAAPTGTRAWIVDRESWVVATAAPAGRPGTRSPSWAERFLFWLVVGDDVDRAPQRSERPLRLDEPLVRDALAGNSAAAWSGEPESAEIRNTVAVPIGVGRGADDSVLGAVVIEANTDGALLFTNRTLGRLLLISLALTLVLVIGLWFLATRLSRRVQSLSSAVSGAMNDAMNSSMSSSTSSTKSHGISGTVGRDGHADPWRDLPMTRDRDELGELARNNARLLRAVADYTRYLRTLAGRLSHELKTPLAITRSSMDNLEAGDLDADSRRYLARAREGLDRQTAIVRAMSEASRLEAAVKAAEWEQVDLAAVVRACVEGYRGAHPGRRIALDVPDEAVPCHCAPDLLAQALDKLVDNALSLMGPEDVVTVVLAPKGNWRHLSVRNTGTRLPDTLQDQLFDSLVSVREAGASGLHLGLGLHIVRLVAEAHGGSVEARNLAEDAGEAGVVFTLHLPAN